MFPRLLHAQYQGSLPKHAEIFICMLCNGPWRAASITLGSLGSGHSKNARLSSPKVTLLSTPLIILATLLSRAKILDGLLGSLVKYVLLRIRRRGIEC
jgi:hypothetical protein